MILVYPIYQWVINVIVEKMTIELFLEVKLYPKKGASLQGL